MKRPLLSVAAAAVVLAAVACQDSSAPVTSAAVSDAFTTLPLGYAGVQSTFGDGSDDGTTEWAPGMHPRGGPGEPGGGRGGGMMCGGLGRFFDLGLGFGRPRSELGGELPAECTYDAGSGRVSCPPATREGLTVTRSASFADASGAVQQAFDPTTTDVVNLRLEVSGTRERRDGNVSTVQHSSDRTVAGLAEGSTTRTTNGTSSGTENTTGTDEEGAFTAVRTIGDAVEGVVVPVSSGEPTYPTAGTITRTMEVTVTREGQAPVSNSRREVVTFDGSSTATVEITENGATRSCSLPLPRGRPTCQ